jgi:ketosteroid isomerase-like protein
MHPHAELIQRFYSCFQDRDAAGMAACYHRQARFFDPVFPDLDGTEVRAMWAMLCERAQDLQVELGAVAADGRAGRAHWEAWYTFSATGRAVHNRIDARFTFEGGMILEHRDSFDLWAWAAQALGWKGRLLGWTPLVRQAIRRQAAASLAGYQAKHGAAGEAAPGATSEAAGPAASGSAALEP